MVSPLNHKFEQAVNQYFMHILLLVTDNKNSEYDQEIPESQTADKPMALGGRATQPSRDHQQPFLNELGEGRRMIIEIIS